MATSILQLLSGLVLINIVNASTNWVCNTTVWTTQSGQWLYNNCSYANGGIVIVDEIQGAVTWIGDKASDSKNWGNYNISLTMQLLESQDDMKFNAGLLFR
eukprot:809567_1